LLKYYSPTKKLTIEGQSLSLKLLATYTAKDQPSKSVK